MIRFAYLTWYDDIPAMMRAGTTFFGKWRRLLFALCELFQASMDLLQFGMELFNGTLRPWLPVRVPLFQHLQPFPQVCLNGLFCLKVCFA